MKTIKMKWIGLAFACFFPTMGFAQQVFTISGKIGNLNRPAKLYLSYYLYEKQKMVRDSVPLKNGSFNFKGIAVKEPLTVELVLSHDGSTMRTLSDKSYAIDETLDHMDKLNIYVENGVNILTSKDSLNNAVIGLSNIERERRLFVDFVKTTKDQMIKLNDEWKNLSKAKRADEDIDETKYIQTLNLLFEAEKEYSEQCILFAKKYPAKFYAGVALRNVFIGADGRSGRIEDERLFRDAQLVKAAYAGLSPDVKKLRPAEAIRYNYTETLQKKKVNIKATNFVQHTADGKAVGLTDFKGKYVFVDFWASWCGPCRGENPNVLRAYNMYKSAGLDILGVSFDDKKEAWLKAVEEDGMPWTQISALKGFENDAAKIYNIQGIPSSLLINPEGEIIAYDLRGLNLEKKLAEIFKK
ncbi:TlpA disulfide reductase family protein [Pedobacter nyackensis]|uniref:TlpA disulfide reductase family protein n=1 Tax=Pedobacter nyackensis TaxID=475255 RepID=UPI00292DBC85|nr:TlpA disulfide reductase family protein [Pedobacter nyackensis]